MKKNNLALNKAVTMVLAGSALTIGAVSSASAAVTTMYNLTTSGGIDNSTNTTNPVSALGWVLQGNTDGWVHGYTTSSPGTDTSVAKWAGTSGQNETPFGYIGAHLNWGMEMTGGNGGTGAISTNDAFNRYGVYADIDAAKGAWSDNVTGNTGVAGGWRHDLDIGLFKSDAAGKVTLNAKGIILSDNTDYGFIIFKGQNTGLGYGHHGAWNSTTNNFGTSALSLVGGGTTFTVDDIVAYSIGDPATNIGSISFDAEAGQVYSIALGGYRTGQWVETIDGYELSISQTPVPVPAAVWLFGSALAGLAGLRRKRSVF